MTDRIPLKFASAVGPLELQLVAQPSQPAELLPAFIGPPGLNGGSWYTHTQAIPAAVWTVPHNLHRRPSITVTDHLGGVVLADLLYLDDDMVQITHGTPLIGFAYCN